MRNIFEQEQYTRPLDGHFVHATVIPVGRRFYSCIEVGTERAVLYSRENPFDTQREAEFDLRTQLRFLYATPLDDLRQAALMPEDYDREPFSIRDHRRMSLEASEEIGEFDTHVPDSIEDPHPKLHYFSRRAMKQGYWINYQTGAMIEVSEHEDWIRNPANAQKIGVPPQMIAEFANFAPQTNRDQFLRYLMEKLPIMRMRGHGSQLSFEYHGRSKAPLDYVWIIAQKEAGPFTTLYIANLATGETASMLYKDFVETMDGAGYEGIMRRGSAELFITTVFVKRAGSTENYLQSLGVQPEVIQYVVSQPADIAKKLVNEVRKNHALTLDQLQQMSEQLASKQTYEPTGREIDLANHYEGIPGMPQWVLLQMKKHRKRKLETGRPIGGEGNFPPYEFEYALPTGDVNTGARPNSIAYANALFNWIADWVRAMGVQIASFDLPSAIEATRKWHEEQAAQGAGNGYKEKNVVHAFTSGWTIQEVRSENDLQVEGNLMGHCVGSYCPQVERGSSTIFSLRDPQNLPHVTLEMQGRASVTPDGPTTTTTGHEGVGWDKTTRPGWKVVQIQGKGNAEPHPEYKAMIKEWFRSIGPKNIEIEGGSDSLYDRIYNAEPEEMEDILNNANGGDETEYGIPRPGEQFDASSMDGIYETILNRLERRNRRDNTYIPRTMDRIAYALADLAWESDMREVKVDPRTWSIQFLGKNVKDPAIAEQIVEMFTKSRSAMSGIHRQMEKHQEEWDRNLFDSGLRMEDFETEEKFFEAEQEVVDDAYREWMMGGFDMAINDRWNVLAKANKGKYPWDVLKDRLTSKKRANAAAV